MHLLFFHPDTIKLLKRNITLDLGIGYTANVEYV